MKYCCLTFSLFLSFSALAQKAQVLIVDENIDSSSLEKNFNVNQRVPPTSALPNKGQRDELLRNLKGTGAWDELQKDIFYMDLKSKSLRDLVKKYPEISKKDIQTLKEKRK